MTTLPVPMPEPQFWKLLTAIDRESLLSGQDDACLLPLKAALSKLPPDDILAFALRVTERLQKLLMASCARQGMYGSDSLLYTACYAIARGQAWFEACLHCPAMFDHEHADPDMSWCEPLLYVSRKAWSLATQRAEDDFPVWTLEEGLEPFAQNMPQNAPVSEPMVAPAQRWPDAFTVYAHFAQHPSIARSVETQENIRINLPELLDDYFWCLLDLGDYLGLEEKAGNCFQMLYDGSKNLYWAEVPVEAEGKSYGQEFSRETLLELLQRLPAQFTPKMFEDAQVLEWDE